MITRMKKITALVSEKEREKFIASLRRAGVFHPEEIKGPVAHEVRFAADKAEKLARMIDELAPYASGAESADTKAAEKEMLATADIVNTLVREKQEYKENICDMQNRMRWFDPWGAFDPDDIISLRGVGVSIRLYRAPRRDFRKAKEVKTPHCKVSHDRNYVYLVSVSRHAEEKLPFEEMALPAYGPLQLQEKIHGLEEKIKITDKTLASTAAVLASARKCKNRLDAERDFLRVKFGMKEEAKFAYIRGFCPEKKVKKITAMAKRHGLGYLVQDPDNLEETPTLITNPKWISIISPVFGFMKTLPGYNEFDISFWFLIFFSIFFAMLIGDAGYGLLFLVVTFVISRVERNLPRQPFFLMYVLSVATIIWGAATGTWFGSERIAQQPFFSMFIVEKLDSFRSVSRNVVIYICFLIGAVHLSVAHLLRAVRVINSVKALAQIGWILILWGMFFTAGTFVIDRPFPSFAGWLFVPGILMVLFFANPDKGIFKGALSSMAQLPLSIISSFGDIVSYLRLFAVGYASVVVASSFNEMALSEGVNGVWSALIAATILFLGHMLNITLGFLAIIVHGVRLNMLEFSSHLSMEWSGRPYEPFAEK